MTGSMHTSLAEGADTASHAAGAPKDGLARRILDLALARGVEVERDGPLMRTLVAADGRGGRDIPEPALMAVAELLAYIYGARTHWNPPLPRNAEGGAP